MLASIPATVGATSPRRTYLKPKIAVADASASEPQSCCRRARFSRSKSWRERKTTASRKGSRPRRRTMRPVLHHSRSVERSRHLLDFNVDHYFGEPQVLRQSGRGFPSQIRSARTAHPARSSGLRLLRLQRVNCIDGSSTRSR